LRGAPLVVIAVAGTVWVARVIDKTISVVVTCIGTLRHRAAISLIVVSRGGALRVVAVHQIITVVVLAIATLRFLVALECLTLIPTAGALGIRDGGKTIIDQSVAIVVQAVHTEVDLVLTTTPFVGILWRFTAWIPHVLVAIPIVVEAVAAGGERAVLVIVLCGGALGIRGKIGEAIAIILHAVAAGGELPADEDFLRIVLGNRIIVRGPASYTDGVEVGARKEEIAHPKGNGHTLPK
jgi:hypothetical protein